MSLKSGLGSLGVVVSNSSGCSMSFRCKSSKYSCDNSIDCELLCLCLDIGSWPENLGSFVLQMSLGESSKMLCFRFFLLPDWDASSTDPSLSSIVSLLINPPGILWGAYPIRFIIKKIPLPRLVVSFYHDCWVRYHYWPRPGVSDPGFSFFLAVFHHLKLCCLLNLTFSVFWGLTLHWFPLETSWGRHWTQNLVSNSNQRRPSAKYHYCGSDCLPCLCLGFF